MCLIRSMMSCGVWLRPYPTKSCLLRNLRLPLSGWSEPHFLVKDNQRSHGLRIRRNHNERNQLIPSLYRRQGHGLLTHRLQNKEAPQRQSLYRRQCLVLQCLYSKQCLTLSLRKLQCGRNMMIFGSVFLVIVCNGNCLHVMCPSDPREHLCRAHLQVSILCQRTPLLETRKIVPCATKSNQLLILRSWIWPLRLKTLQGKVLRMLPRQLTP